MAYKQKGFPMHFVSALKQTLPEEVVTEEPVVTEEESTTVSTSPKDPGVRNTKLGKVKVDDEGHQTMLRWVWETDPITRKRTKVPRYERF